jgi:methyltransferase (TIGR00027 family)
MTRAARASTQPTSPFRMPRASGKPARSDGTIGSYDRPVRDDHESRSAVLVAAGRAAMDGRTPVARFADPTAMVLIPPDMRERVRQVRDGEQPKGRAAMGYVMLRATAALMVPRTVAIDDAIRDAAASTDQLVILGAGLDGRAWRLPELANTVVYEVDHPASQAAKRDRAASLPVAAREIRYVPVDFRTDNLAEALASATHDPQRPTTWLWEGVVPYLTDPQIRATLQVISARSAPATRLVVNYNTPSLIGRAGRLLGRLFGSGSERNLLAEEPQHSFYRPPAFAALLAEHGFRVTTDRDLVEIAHELDADTTDLNAYARTARVAVSLHD